MTGSTLLRVNAEIAIPRREIRFSFVRSSGPGGQNVNKVASKAVLRWPIATSRSVPSELRARLIARLARRINDRGELVLASQRFRDQAKNVEDALQKLCDLVASAAKMPKKRKKTRAPKAVREARLRQKRQTGERKQSRRPPTATEHD
ncbi:MAG TPA: alternative ribosome rescue aminoacyl-tRNA hydrolase ArfB [Lacipirellulaceae bacterium]|nr:alternative ribosome rescue aminoacyl-tRNA hydrolase ArfB [Lacipirellulaceae bacterium]